jgi:hypothetical protein
MLNSIELLDRFEILEPENLALRHLRRCIVDKDVRSVFKVFQHFHSNDNIQLAETACLDLNAYAFFKLEENMFGSEDMPLLKKIIWQQNPWAIFTYLANQNVDPMIVKNIKGIMLLDKPKCLIKLLERQLPEDDLGLYFFTRLFYDSQTYDVRKIHECYKLFISKGIDIFGKDEKMFISMLNKVPLNVVKFCYRLYNKPWLDDIRKSMVLEDKIHYVWKVCEELLNPDIIKELKIASKNKFFGMKMKPVFNRYNGNNFYKLYQKATDSNAKDSVKITNALDMLGIVTGETNIINDVKGGLLYDNREALYNVVKYTSKDSLIDTLQRFESELPKVSLNDAFSRGQLFSKKWLVSKIKDLKLGTIILCAGWHGSLIYLFNREGIKFKQCFSFDMNPNCIKTSELLNKELVLKNWKFKATHADILKIDYNPCVFKTEKADGSTETKEIKPNTIINTSCEHIKNYDIWYNKLPKRKLIILQSNNYYEQKEHINCVKDIEEFKQSSPMSNILFEGTLNLGMYKRFMLIGKK